MLSLPRPLPGSPAWKAILSGFFARFVPGSAIWMEAYIETWYRREGLLYDQLCQKYCPECIGTVVVHQDDVVDSGSGDTVLGPHGGAASSSIPAQQPSTSDFFVVAAEGWEAPTPPAHNTVVQNRPKPPANRPGSKRTICSGYQGDTVADVICWGDKHGKCPNPCPITSKGTRGMPYFKGCLHVCIWCRRTHETPRNWYCKW